MILCTLVSFRLFPLLNRSKEGTFPIWTFPSTRNLFVGRYMGVPRVFLRFTDQSGLRLDELTVGRGDRRRSSFYTPWNRLFYAVPLETPRLKWRSTSFATPWDLGPSDRMFGCTSNFSLTRRQNSLWGLYAFIVCKWGRSKGIWARWFRSKASRSISVKLSK